MRNMGAKGAFPTVPARAMETAAAGGNQKAVAAHLFIYDFHRCLEKPPLKNALRLFHSSHSAGLDTPHREKRQGTIFLAEEDVDGGYGNPQKARIPTATGNRK
jgi:hypothetical protein